MTLTPAPEHRRSLPMLTETRTGTRHGSRSFATCFYRCGNACDHPEPNTSENRHIQDVITKALERRSVLKGAAAGTGALVASTALLTGGATAAAAAESARKAGPTNSLAKAAFKSVKPNKRDAVTVPDGFDWDMIIGWGDPVEPGSPTFDVFNQTVGMSRMVFGYNCDYVGLYELDAKNALLIVNHEYTNPNLMFPTGKYSNYDIRAIEMGYHGMSVVHVKRGLVPGSWLRVRDLNNAPNNRRIHIATEFRVSGPAAGDALLQTTADPTGTKVLGTLNNCAGGMTPWGTVLSGEENFNGFFDRSGAVPSQYAAQYARYGITGTGRGWMEVDPRFDLTANPHEPHRFGWIVEVDPLSPNQAPVKHTMLGRFKHEGANITVSTDGYAVAYMGDDERGDYVYKFVSKNKVAKGTGTKARNKNKKLLEAGTLYVAKFTDEAEDAAPEYDGIGEWIPLCSDTESFVVGMSVAEVLVFTRLAADAVSPTKMDRPEDVEPNPVNGKIYAAMTNNSNRGGSSLPVDEANPIGSSKVRSSLGAPLTTASGNRNGYVLEITEDGGDHAGTTFTWDLMLVCGDPAAPETYFAGFDKTQVSPISCPDNVSFDSVGNLWVATDGNVLGSNDGLFRVPVAGPNRGKVEQFLTVSRNAETCGPLIADDDRSLFFAVQHPGESDAATFETPVSTWPHTDDFPRPSVCVAFRQA